MKKSVVMATYNGAQFLREQLDTIRTQTASPDEVIVCDDCSADDTVKVAREYIAEYKLTDSWHVYENEKNLGYANNFNKATNLATGDLIFFSDQDDTWRENKMEIMCKLMEEHPDCDVLSTDYNPWYYGNPDKKAPEEILARMPDNGSLEKISLGNRSLYIGAIGCCMCVRRTFLEEIKDYWFDSWAQDDRMWRLSQCSDGCYILHSNLINHRIHSNNTSTYGKYHTLDKRVKHFEGMQAANEQMLAMLMDSFNATDDVKAKETLLAEIKIVNKHIKMMKLRISLLSKNNTPACVPLLGYLKYYEKTKSFLVEIFMVLKGK